MKKREQAEARAMELFPEVDGNDCLWTSRKVVERERDAFLQCFDEMSKHKDITKTCGYCVKEKTAGED